MIPLSRLKRGVRMKLNRYLHYEIIILFLLLFYITLSAQESQVKNVRFKDKGNSIVVYYDLLGKFGKKYEISLFLSDDYGRTFKIRPVTIRGDVGKDIKPGKYKMIIWNIEEDYPNGLNGDGFVFAVHAELQKEAKKWPYFLIGAAGAAGGLFYFITKNKTENSTTGSIIIDIPSDF